MGCQDVRARLASADSAHWCRCEVNREICMSRPARPQVNSDAALMLLVMLGLTGTAQWFLLIPALLTLPEKAWHMSHVPVFSYCRPRVDRILNTHDCSTGTQFRMLGLVETGHTLPSGASMFLGGSERVEYGSLFNFYYSPKLRVASLNT